MPLTDYQDMVVRMQRALARAWSETPDLLNVPGRSVAFKIDPHYYLAGQPEFDDFLARWTALRPESVAEALVRTGNYITAPPERTHVLDLEVVLAGDTHMVRACFVDADFVDRALKLYAGASSGLGLSDLRLSQGSRAAVGALFKGKTPPGKLAYA